MSATFTAADIVTILRVRDEMSAALKSAEATSRTVAKDIGASMKQVGQSVSDAGLAITKLTAPLALIAGGAAKLGIDFESSFAGVRKTVEATEEEFAALAQGFRDLSKEIPVNVNELARLGEAAGALGIPKEEILSFARVMAELGVTTDVTSDQAADAIARIQNIFGAAGKNTEQFASTLVALGNAGASTESEILELAQRLAGAGSVVGLTQGEVLAFASSLASVGINAEAGGSALSKVFIELAGAVSAGGDDLEDFADVAGISGEEFARAFKDNAALATTAFIEGLGGIKAAGGDLFGVLASLGIEEVRMRDTLLRTAGAGDLVRESLALQADAWQKNTALAVEAGQRFATTESQITLLWNRTKDLGITLFDALKPAIEAALSAADRLIPIIERVVGAFAAAPQPVQLAALAIGGILTAAGPVLFILGQLVTAVGTVGTAFGVLSGALPGAGVIIAALTGPIGIALGAVALLAAAWFTFGDDIKRIAKEAYDAVASWLNERFGPVLEPMKGLLSDLGEMWDAFALLVGAVGSKVVEKVGEMVGGVVSWLVDRLQPIWQPIGAALTGMKDVFVIVAGEISGIAQRLYESIKTWLLDRFTDVVNGVREKVQAVTGFFRDLYDQVVGHSFVPDLIAGVQAEFARLDEVMLRPTEAATRLVSGVFDRLKSSGLTKMQGLLDGLSEKLKTTLPGIFGKEGIFGSLISSGLSSVFGPGGPLMGLVSRGIAALTSIAMRGLGELWGGIKKLFGGGEHGTVVNPARDQFFSQFGDTFAEIAGNITAGVERAGIGDAGRVAERLIRDVFNAKTKRDFDAASGTIDRILSGGGITSGVNRDYFPPGVIPGDSYAGGTPNLGFMDFAGGRTVRLHGEEAIIPKSKADQVGLGGGQISALLEKFDRLELALVHRLPRAIGRSVTDGLVGNEA